MSQRQSRRWLVQLWQWWRWLLLLGLGSLHVVGLGLGTDRMRGDTWAQNIRDAFLINDLVTTG